MTDATPPSDAIMIQEIRGDDLDDVVRFALEHDSEIKPTRVRLRASVLARDHHDQLQGVACCSLNAEKRTRIEIIVTPELAQTPLPRQLLDKALSKMRCDHIHRCSIQFPQTSAAEHTWSATRWGADALTASS